MSFWQVLVGCCLGEVAAEVKDTGADVASQDLLDCGGLGRIQAVQEFLAGGEPVSKGDTLGSDDLLTVCIGRLIVDVGHVVKCGKPYIFFDLLPGIGSVFDVTGICPLLHSKRAHLFEMAGVDTAGILEVFQGGYPCQIGQMSAL